MILRQQERYTKYLCFLCEWNNRNIVQHWIKTDWPQRASLTNGNKNVVKEALVELLKIPLPPLHIKLGIMKHFVKDGLCFMHLCDKFMYLSDAKIKEGIFVRPEIRKLM